MNIGCSGKTALRKGNNFGKPSFDSRYSEFKKRADFDREYDENLSFSGDVRLLVNTVSVVLRGTGY